jgi:hypothetical protein
MEPILNREHVRRSDPGPIAKDSIEKRPRKAYEFSGPRNSVGKKESTEALDQGCRIGEISSGTWMRILLELEGVPGDDAAVHLDVESMVPCVIPAGGDGTKRVGATHEDGVMWQYGPRR